ncbi:unnamed protein product [Rotaria sp. Silwood2]|nr:unnamed protein product [Rotaria sp. Silwood2]
MVLLKNIDNQSFFQLDHDESLQSYLDKIAHQNQLELNNKQFALFMDDHNLLDYIRQKFFYPKLGTLPKDVDGHFIDSCVPTLSLFVDGQIDEVVLMNQLSSNLHFMIMAFYQPEGDRYKI